MDAVAPVVDEAPPVHARPQFRSFKRSERMPRPEAAALREVPAAPLAPDAVPLVSAIPTAAARQRKPLRSLKQSAPAAAPVPPLPAADSKLPVHRHSEQELAEARRRDALAVMAQGAYQLPGAAHPVLLAIGYVLAIGGAAAPTLLDGLSRLTGSFTLGLAFSHGYDLLVGGSLAALPIAGFVLVRKSLSRHHAAFIASIAFFALVFAAIHFIPQLRHAT